MNRFLLIISFFAINLFQTNAQTGIVKGRITDAANNSPIAFATVSIVEASTGASSDEEGNYEIQNLKPGFYNISVSYVGYSPKTISEVQVTNSKPAIIDFQLETSVSDIEIVEVKAKPFIKTEESPLSLRSIGTTEIQRNPGGGRDISKVVASLPGVTTTASFRNDLLIRGGAPNENRFYLDDVEVPNINHFATQGASGGPVGLINVDFIREVNFFSGAFPANRGNSLSSVFNFQQKNGRDDRLGLTATLGSSDFALTAEGPLSKDKQTTFLASARQSYLQFLFKALQLPFLPTYNDFQVKVRRRFNDKNELYFVGLGAIDRFKLNLDANETESQRFLLNNLPVNNQWNYTNGLVYKRYYENGFWTFVASRNMLNNEAYKYPGNDETLPDSMQILRYKSQEIENKLRVENTVRISKFKFNIGINADFVKYTNRTYNRISTPSQIIKVDYNSTLSFLRLGFFAQASRKFFNERLSTSLGLRLDQSDYSKETNNPLKQLSPRASLSYQVNERIAINANGGIFYQLPPYTTLGFRDNSGELVNRTLGVKYIRCTHGVAGVEYNTDFNARITVEGYYKLYNNYPFLLRDSLTLANVGGNFGVIGNEPSVSTKDGRSFGLEVLYQQKLYKGFYGILAYTLGKSEFKNKNNQFVASSWDARHIVNFVLGKQFKKNWEVGVKFRMQTALPYTPFDEQRSALVSVWDITGAGLKNYSLLNTRRGDISHQLDFRVDKKWYFKKISLNLYLDVQNVYGSSVGSEQLVLDLDANGSPVRENIGTPYESYKLKNINDASGTSIPTIGVIVQY